MFSPKLCVPKKTKNIKVKVFDMITNINEAKTKTKHISYDFKCKFNSTIYNSNQKWNNKTCKCESKNYLKWKKIIVGILARVFLRIASIQPLERALRFEIL